MYSDKYEIIIVCAFQAIIPKPSSLNSFTTLFITRALLAVQLIYFFKDIAAHQWTLHIQRKKKKKL